MAKKTLGEVVKHSREALRLTQRELATVVEVKASHIAYIEGNRRRPSIALLRRLVEALGLDRREALLLAHPDARYLIDAPPRLKQSSTGWKEFAANHALLRRHEVTPAELRILKEVSLLERVANPQHFLFILNSIRQASCELRK